MEVGKQVVIVDDNKLPQFYSQYTLKHYRNGTVTTIKSIINGFVELGLDTQTNGKGHKYQVSTISLYGDEINAIEVIE